MSQITVERPTRRVPLPPRRTRLPPLLPDTPAPPVEVPEPGIPAQRVVRLLGVIARGPIDRPLLLDAIEDWPKWQVDRVILDAKNRGLIMAPQNGRYVLTKDGAEVLEHPHPARTIDRSPRTGRRGGSGVTAQPVSGDTGGFPGVPGGAKGPANCGPTADATPGSPSPSSDSDPTPTALAAPAVDTEGAALRAAVRAQRLTALAHVVETWLAGIRLETRVALSDGQVAALHVHVVKVVGL